MGELRSVFLGNDPWSALALREATRAAPSLIPSLVVTREPRPARRGAQSQPTPVAAEARLLGLPLVELGTIRDARGTEVILEAEPDVLAVVAYGEILPSEILAIPTFGAVNLHLSLLPRWRGASPVQRTLQAGDALAGVTTMVIDAGLDEGPVLERWSCRVEPREDAGSLGARLATTGGALLAHSVHGLRAGTLTATPQPADGVTYAPKLTVADRRIAWDRPAVEVDRWVRAVSPEPGATTTFRDAGVRVVRGEPVTGSGAPGVLLEGDDGGVEVGTTHGRYRLLEVAPAGRKRMAASDWARGARFEPGERLGAGPAESP